MLNRYILDENGQPHPEPDRLAWVRWFETSYQQRVVVQDEVFPGIKVSTVFLGVDHNWNGKEPPQLWQSIIFAPDNYPLGGEQQRYASLTEARAGHAVLVRHVRAVGPHKETSP